MAALTATNGIVTIANTTDTYTSGTADNRFLPAAAVMTFSTTGRMVLTDKDGAVLLDLTAPANTTVPLDAHYFQKGMSLWKSPIKCTGTFPAGGKLRLYGM